MQTAVGFPNFDGNIGFEKLDSELQTKLNSLLDLLKYEPINPIEKTNDMTQPVGVDENGQLWVAPIGGGSSGDNTGGGDIPNSHDIIYDLINVNSSSAVVSVADSMPFVTVLTADEGYTLGDVTVTMGGEVLTGVWNAETSTLTIVSVTGDVIISCVATQGIDTSVRIAKSGYGFNSDATEEIVTAPLCISDYYDIPEGYIGKLSYYFPSIGTNAIGGYMKLQMVDDTYTKVEYYSISVSSEGEKSVGFSTSGTVEKGAVKFRFSLEEATVDDAYMYFSGTGDVVFAGKNTPYYRMANIDGTMAGGGSVATGELSFDDDMAMNYGIATTSIMGDEIAKNPQDVYDLSSAFATVIDNAKREWMLEYGGDFRKIPIVVSTDQHGLTHSGIFNMLGKTLSMYDVSKVMNLGDTVSAWSDADTEHPLISCTQLENWCESVKAIPFSKQLNVFGNHDTWYGNYEDEGNPIGTRYPSSQTHLNQYFRNIYARRTNNNGWFVDYDNQFNVKYVVVSAFEYKNDSVQFRISTEQMKFIIEELSKNDGYDIVIVSHVPLRSDPNLFIFPTGQTSTETGRVSALNTDDLFSARKTKGSGTITDSDGVEHNYDFTACESQLLCSLHGHTHYDAYLHLNDSLLVNAFDWFDDNTFFFVLIDRVNNQLNVWKVEAPNNTPTYTNYQIPFEPV